MLVLQGKTSGIYNLIHSQNEFHSILNFKPTNFKKFRKEVYYSNTVYTTASVVGVWYSNHISSVRKD